MSLIIASVSLCIAVLLLTLCFTMYYNKTHKSKKGYFSLLLSFCPLVILLFGCFVKVGANEVGIIYDDRKGVLEETIGEGFRTKSVFWHVTNISTANRTAIITTTGQTNDGQYATFQLSIIYKIEAKNAGLFFKQTNDIVLNNNQLENLVKQSLQSSTIKYDIFELLSEGLEVARLDFEDRLSKNLLEKYYVTLVSTSFDEVDAGDNIELILQQKAEADQRIEIAQKQAQADLITAENEVLLAEQEAKVQKTLADALAYAIEKEGEANAEAATQYVTKINAMIENIKENTGLSYEESTEIVLSIIFYDTWNGELPEVLTNDSLSSMIGGLLAKDQATNNETNSNE